MTEHTAPVQDGPKFSPAWFLLAVIAFGGGLGLLRTGIAPILLGLALTALSGIAGFSFASLPRLLPEILCRTSL